MRGITKRTGNGSDEPQDALNNIIKEVEMFENIILVVEKELRETYNFHGGFNYLDCDPEGANRVSKAYKEYKTLLNELKQLKETTKRLK